MEGNNNGTGRTLHETERIEPLFCCAVLVVCFLSANHYLHMGTRQEGNVVLGFYSNDLESGKVFGSDRLEEWHHLLFTSKPTSGGSKCFRQIFMDGISIKSGETNSQLKLGSTDMEIGMRKGDAHVRPTAYSKQQQETATGLQQTTPRPLPQADHGAICCCCCCFSGCCCVRA